MNRTIVELLWRLLLPIGTILFLPLCLLIGWTIRVWDLELGYWLTLRYRFWHAVHDGFEWLWHWSYRAHLSTLYYLTAAKRTPKVFTQQVGYDITYRASHSLNYDIVRLQRVEREIKPE